MTQMAINYMSSVPKLLGRENYDDWAFAVENVLVLEGLTKCLDGTETDTVLNAKAKAKLVLTLDAALYVHVKEATTAKEVWDKLKAMYDASGISRKISLLRALISLRLENCDSMEVYVNQVVETAQKLRRTGFDINDKWVGSLLLAGLPEKYSPMIMAIEHSGISIETDAIKSKLLDMQVDGSSSRSSGALAVAAKGHYKNRHKDGGRSNKTEKTEIKRHMEASRHFAELRNGFEDKLSVR